MHPRNNPTPTANGASKVPEPVHRRKWLLSGNYGSGGRALLKKTNIAPFMICRNEEMLKLALWAAHRKKPIEPETKLTIRCQNRYKTGLLAALLEAQKLPVDQWPEKVKSDRSKRLSNTTQKVIDNLKAECEKVANELNLAPQLLASRMALTRIVVNKATTLEQIQKKRILMNWQANLLQPTIKKVLEQ